MRRHASSLAFFVCGFLVAATVIQISYAQSKSTSASGRETGGIVVDSQSQNLFVVQGNRVFQIPTNAFDQSHVRSVILK